MRLLALDVPPETYAQVIPKRSPSSGPNSARPMTVSIAAPRSGTCGNCSTWRGRSSLISRRRPLGRRVGRTEVDRSQRLGDRRGIQRRHPPAPRSFHRPSRRVIASFFTSGVVPGSMPKLPIPPTRCSYYVTIQRRLASLEYRQAKRHRHKLGRRRPVRHRRVVLRVNRLGVATSALALTAYALHAVVVVNQCVRFRLFPPGLLRPAPSQWPPSPCCDDERSRELLVTMSPQSRSEYRVLLSEA